MLLMTCCSCALVMQNAARAYWPAFGGTAFAFGLNHLVNGAIYTCIMHAVRVCMLYQQPMHGNLAVMSSYKLSCDMPGS
jgi:hypothetical protein